MAILVELHACAPFMGRIQPLSVEVGFRIPTNSGLYGIPITLHRATLWFGFTQYTPQKTKQKIGARLESWSATVF